MILAAALALCGAWTMPEETAESDDGATAGEDTSVDACIADCKETDHRSCKAVCTSSRWPSCAVAHPGQ